VRSWRSWLLGLIALVAIVIVGLRQAPEGTAPRQPTVSRLGADDVRAKLANAPPRLAALHRQANALLPGSRTALVQRLRTLRGHPAVVNVWAAWCGPCRAELPIFQRAALDWGERVAFVGVDVRDSAASAARLLREIPVPYPSYQDPEGEIATAYRLVGTPSTIYYDAAGAQTHVHAGPYLTRSALDADIRRHALGKRE
jgi:cytochrome c biogenesis protein CcmG/thiol:disulfide interchange protein DsbE